MSKKKLSRFTDKELIISIIQSSEYGYSVFEYISDDLKEDKDFLYKLTFVEKFRTYNPMHLKITKLFK